MVKVCGGCGEVKEVALFNKQSSAYDGLQSQCKKCQSEYKKAYYKNRLEYFKEYRNKNK